MEQLKVYQSDETKDIYLIFLETWYQRKEWKYNPFNSENHWCITNGSKKHHKNSKWLSGTTYHLSISQKNASYDEKTYYQSFMKRISTYLYCKLPQDAKKVFRASDKLIMSIRLPKNTTNPRGTNEPLLFLR